MEEQFERLGVKGERVEAVTPADIPAADRQRYCDRSSLAWLTEAELSCNYSHIKIWRKMLSLGITQALILEDDVILSGSLPMLLDALDKEPQPGIVRTETLNLPTLLAPGEQDVMPGVSLRRSFHFDNGSGAYVIDHASAAILADLPEMRTTLVDAVLFNPFGTAHRLRVRYTDPGFCIQLSVAGQDAEGLGKSGLQGEREVRRQSWRERPWTKWRLKMLSWVSLDARAFLIKLRAGAYRWRPQVVWFMPD
jgi:GR25 family glycosyltransferase involved in LPS biosynthesis